ERGQLRCTHVRQLFGPRRRSSDEILRTTFGTDEVRADGGGERHQLGIAHLAPARTHDLDILTRYNVTDHCVLPLRCYDAAGTEQLPHLLTDRGVLALTQFLLEQRRN